MAQEQGVSPAAVSKKEWDDVMGARLAKVIEVNPESAYEEKAAAYVEDKERVKPEPRQVDEYSPIRMSYRPSYTYSFAQKLKEKVSTDEISLLIEALQSSELDEQVEFEKYYNSAATAFNRAKSPAGWSKSAIKAPDEYQERLPKVQLSKWLDDDEESGNKQLSICDESGQIAIVAMSATGTVKGLSFN